MTKRTNPVVRNLVILVFGALPLTIMAGWLVTVISPPEWMQGTERGPARDYASGFLFWFLVLALPVLIGALLHQLAIRAIPASWSATKQRWAILATAAVVPLGFVLIGNSPDQFANLKLVIPISVGMVFYGLLAKPVRRDAVA